MAWSTPLTAVANATLTAAQWNASVRDNFAETAPAKASAAGQFFVSTAANAIAARTPLDQYVGTSETSASTSYTALATPGPVVTVTTGTKVLIAVSAWVSNNLGGGQSLMSYKITGATTVTEDDAWAMRYTSSSASHASRISAVTLHTGLTPGSNVFTALYRVLSGTGSWGDRRVVVVPF